LAHEDLELIPGSNGLVAGQGDHSGIVRTNGRELRSMVLDAAVPCDVSQPRRATSAIHTVSGVVVLVTGQGGRWRLCTTTPGSPG
jgi:hypothetical protein